MSTTSRDSYRAISAEIRCLPSQIAPATRQSAWVDTRRVSTFACPLTETTASSTLDHIAYSHTATVCHTVQGNQRMVPPNCLPSPLRTSHSENGTQFTTDTTIKYHLRLHPTTCQCNCEKFTQDVKSSRYSNGGERKDKMQLTRRSFDRCFSSCLGAV